MGCERQSARDTIVDQGPSCVRCATRDEAKFPSTYAPSTACSGDSDLSTFPVVEHVLDVHC